MNVLAIQRTNTSVEFVNYSSTSGLDNVEYSQSCKGKNAAILGFIWTHSNEILLVTDHGVELFLVNILKQTSLRPWNDFFHLSYRRPIESVFRYENLWSENILKLFFQSRYDSKVIKFVTTSLITVVILPRIWKRIFQGIKTWNFEDWRYRNCFLQVVPEKRSVKALKSLSLGVNWFVFCPQSYLILLSSGTIGNQMQALHITPGNLHKLTKFESESKRIVTEDAILFTISLIERVKNTSMTE